MERLLNLQVVLVENRKYALLYEPWLRLQLHLKIGVLAKLAPWIRTICTKRFSITLTVGKLIICSLTLADNIDLQCGRQREATFANYFEFH